MASCYSFKRMTAHSNTISGHANMKKPLIFAIAIISAIFCSQAHAQAPKVASKVNGASAKKSASKVKVSLKRVNGVTQSVKGKWEGKPCHGKGKADQSIEEVTVECSIGGKSATCVCKASCTNTCVGSPGKFSTECDLDLGSCSVKPTGGSGSTGVGAGAKVPQ